jgi:hypothetical protein
MTDHTDTRFPCGCFMFWVGDVLAFEPHAMDCPYFRYFTAEAERQGKTPDVMDLR